MEPWNPNMDVGVQEMDEAHRGLDHQIKVALEAVQKGNAPAVAATLASVVADLRLHFTSEEAMMEESAYRERGAHAEAHAAYLGELEDVASEFPASGLSPRFQLWFGSRLAPWLKLHIRGLDAQFARHYRAWQEKQAKAAEAKLIAGRKDGTPVEGGVPGRKDPPAGGSAAG